MYILASKHKGIFASIIRFLTCSKINHLDVIISKNEILGAISTTKRKITGEVIIQNLDFILSNKSLIDYEVYKVDLLNEDKAITFLINQIGKPYDWIGIIAFLFKNRKWQNDNKWFCSELVAEACIQGGLLDIVKLPTNGVSPGKFVLSKYCKKISLKDIVF